MPKKLIEVALPLEAINREAAREKSIRHGHPSTLHLWWARRPLAACRAVLFSSLVDDPEDPEAAPAYLKLLDGLRGKGSRRDRLFQFIEQLVKWENSNDEQLLDTARAMIRACTGDNPPPVLDPFCGGGSIPLEAQRLGLTAYASDLNPVAVLITKALIEIPPRFAGQAPVHPGSAGFQPAPDEKSSASFQPPSERSAGFQPASGSQDAEPAGSRRSKRRSLWHSRGYLPHFEAGEIAQAVTFRLADSLPAEKLAEWRQEWATLPPGEAAQAERERIQEYLDRGHGLALLRDPRAAEIVQAALLHFDGERYALHAWMIMPNHVHVLFTPLRGYDLSEILHSWKSFTANRINRLFGSSGPLWQREYFDRYIRNREHFAAEASYIEGNPVKAGLCDRPEAWPYGSASWSAGFQPASGSQDAEPAGSRRSQERLLSGTYRGAQGLAEDVRYYGQWMRERAEARIGHLYPKGPNGETVIAWLWARTVTCPNPACGATMPLVRSFALSTKKGKEAWVEPVVEGDRVAFTVKTGRGKPPEGTVDRRGARCICCGSPVEFNHIRAEGKAGRMGAQMMAVVLDGSQGRSYLAPMSGHASTAATASPDWRPESDLPEKALGFRVQLYGMTKHADLFTPRQLVALTTFSDLVGEAREQVLADARAAGQPDDPTPLADGGSGATAYADAVATYLALSVDRVAVLCSSIASWISGLEAIRGTFARQALPMVWDFAECNPVDDKWMGAIRWIVNVITALVPSAPGDVAQMDAVATRDATTAAVVSTDPPYYDNIGYADLSDFFYVWLRRSLREVWPDLFATLLVPKAPELVATPHRFKGGKDEARRFFEDGLGRAFDSMHRLQDPAQVMTVYYAFKQAETEDDSGATSATASTGWETMLAGLLRAGFTITGTWPVRSERSVRTVSLGTNALASSIVLACRPRPEDAPLATRQELVAALRRELPAALRELTTGVVAPVDLAQAAIGPGMAVFSRYAKVLEADGSPLPVRAALQIINQELDRFFAEQDGALDPDTRFCIEWFTQFGLSAAAFGDAETLSKAKNISVEGLVRAGVAESQRGKVRLLRREELDADWDPVTDQRLTVWEATHHLIRALETGGEEAAGRLLARLGSGLGETARELAYRLYTLCERQGWADPARDYNNLVVSWPAIQEWASKIGLGEQARLL